MLACCFTLALLHQLLEQTHDAVEREVPADTLRRLSVRIAKGLGEDGIAHPLTLSCGVDAFAHQFLAKVVRLPGVGFHGFVQCIDPILQHPGPLLCRGVPQSLVKIVEALFELVEDSVLQRGEVGGSYMRSSIFSKAASSRGPSSAGSEKVAMMNSATSIYCFWTGVGTCALLPGIPVVACAWSLRRSLLLPWR